MKPILSSRSRGGAAVALCLAAALPLTAKADRRWIPQGGAAVTAPRSAPAPAARPAPSAPRVSVSPPVSRPPSVSRPTMPSSFSPPSRSVPRATVPSVSRPSFSGGSSGRPSFDSSRRPPTSVARPSFPSTGRTPGVVSRPSLPGVISERPGTVPTVRPALPADRGSRDPRRPGSGSVVTRPSIPLPGSTGAARPSFPGSSVVGRAPSRPSLPTPSAVPGVSRDSLRHRHFTDASRFASVDRHVSYRSYPRQHYRLNYCNGYRGMGWYYGPPNYTYYYEAPYVMYFSSRSVIPATYLSYSYTQPSQLEYEVQSALYELGYYTGPLDGAIGPMSRLAIANFQADNGLEPTGIIDETLLYYLGIQ